MPAKRTNRRQRRRMKAKDDIVVLRGFVRDLVAAHHSQEFDAADDKRWLAAHPLADARHRLPTCREVAAYGLPPGCTVVVGRGPMGTQIRMFYPPQE